MRCPKCLFTHFIYFIPFSPLPCQGCHSFLTNEVTWHQIDQTSSHYWMMLVVCVCVCSPGHEPTALDTVEAFHPKKKKWERLAPMTFPRCSTSSIVIRDRLLVVGGVNQVNLNNTTDNRYHLRSPCIILFHSTRTPLMQCVGETIYNLLFSLIKLNWLIGSLWLTRRHYKLTCKA